MIRQGERETDEQFHQRLLRETVRELVPKADNDQRFLDEAMIAWGSAIAVHPYRHTLDVNGEAKEATDWAYALLAERNRRRDEERE